MNFEPTGARVGFATARMRAYERPLSGMNVEMAFQMSIGSERNIAQLTPERLLPSLRVSKHRTYVNPDMSFKISRVWETFIAAFEGAFEAAFNALAPLVLDDFREKSRAMVHPFSDFLL